MDQARREMGRIKLGRKEMERMARTEKMGLMGKSSKLKTSKMKRFQMMTSM